MLLDHRRDLKLVVSLLLGMVATLKNPNCRGFETIAKRECEDFQPGRKGTEVFVLL